MRVLNIILFLLILWNSQAQIVKLDIGNKSQPQKEIFLELAYRFQHNNPKPLNPNDIYDRSIYSPKSVIFSNDGSKFYIHSLEGYKTSVYSTKSMKRIKIIEHKFGSKQRFLFKKKRDICFGLFLL